MNERKILTIIDDLGKKIEYEILMAFKWNKTGKNYIVYTDNTEDERGNLNVLAAIYYPPNEDKLYAIETDEEWDEIEKRLNILQH